MIHISKCFIFWEWSNLEALICFIFWEWSNLEASICFIFWEWSNLEASICFIFNLQPLNDAWHLVGMMGSCLLTPARHVLFCETAPNDSIQGHFTNLSGFNPLKSGAGEIPFWWGGHKTRNVGIRRSENQRRDHMTSCENFCNGCPPNTWRDPLTWRLLLEQLVRLSPSTSHTHIQEDGVRHSTHSTPALVCPQKRGEEHMGCIIQMGMKSQILYYIEAN